MYNYLIHLVICTAEVEEEDEEQRETRCNRQREALIQFRDEDSISEVCIVVGKSSPTTGVKASSEAPHSSSTIKVPHKRHHNHLSVSSAVVSNGGAKCAKTLIQSTSSQQRHRQLQFLRHVHSSQRREKASEEIQYQRYKLIYA